jgi:lysophospholipase L1-like esterase
MTSVLIAASILVIATIVLFRRKLALPPEGNPRAFLRKGRRKTTTKLVVCAGDSLTHGFNSGDYVALLRGQLGGAGYEFVNAGLNGDMAYNLRQRLDEIIACRPDMVTLLIGTNDVLGTLGESWANYYMSAKKSPQPPTLDWYRQNLSGIVQRVVEETDAAVAILSLPVLGEEQESEINARLSLYNEAIKELSDADGVTYLPLNERIRSVLETAPSSSPTPIGGNFRQSGQRILAAMVRHYLWRESWDAVASRDGSSMFIDQIHLNDRGAALVAGLVRDWLTNQPD